MVPIVTLGRGGQGTHSLTGTPRSRGYLSKEHLPFVQGSFQHGLDHTSTWDFFGVSQAWGTPSHPTCLSRQDSSSSVFPRPPSPVLSGGPPEQGAAAGPGRAPRAGGSPWTRAPSRGQREKLLRICSGYGERELRDPHGQHSRQDWGEPKSPRATSPVPSRPEPPAGDRPHNGTARVPRSRGRSDAPSWSREWDLPGRGAEGAPRDSPQHTGLSYAPALIPAQDGGL